MLFRIECQSKRLTIGIILSLIIHFILLTGVPQRIVEGEKIANSSPLPVRAIKAKELEKYRQVGVKDGAKNAATPLYWGPKASPFSLESVRPRVTDSKKILPRKKGRDLKRRDLTLKGDIGAIGSIRKNLLRQADFYINFVPPEGVKEDELNSAEKIFWSFRKRVTESFATSLLKTYRRFLLERPQITKSLTSARGHSTVGRAIFDEKGNTIKIRIIRPSSDDYIQALFEETLKSIGKIPNPPRGLLEDRELTLYYQLVFNP